MHIAMKLSVKTFFSYSQDPMESGARLVSQFIAVGVSMMGT